jgi:hypothetical protein
MKSKSGLFYELSSTNDEQILSIDALIRTL